MSLLTFDITHHYIIVLVR